MNDEIVIRSAVFTGGKVREALGEVMEHIKNRSIHIPSTWRLFRMVNCRTCERLENCYDYNMLTKSSKDISKIAKRPFGLCICNNCAQSESASLLPFPYRHRDDYFAAVDRVARVDKTRLLCQPHVESSTGERAGPLILGKDISQIASTYDANNPEGRNERTDALNKILENIDKDAPTNQEERAERLVAIYTTAEIESYAFEHRKYQLTHDKKRAKENERNTKKLANMRAVYSKLSSQLDDYPRKECALECTWHERWAYCDFNLLPSQLILGRLLSAPSSATQKKITTCVANVIEAYDLLHQNGFLDSNFLNFISNSSNSNLSSRADSALHRYCLQTFRNCAGLLKLKRGASERVEAVLTLLRDGNPAAALCRLLGDSYLRDVFISALTSTSPQESLSKYETFAGRIWDRIAVAATEQEATGPVDIHQRFVSRFNRARREYRSLNVKFWEYMNEEATAEFLAETSRPIHHPHQTFTRLNAVYKTLENGRGEDMLRDRQFTELRALHLRIFQNPRDFGYFA